MQHSIWIWVAFTSAILVLLLVDLRLAGRRRDGLSRRQAAWWSVSWVLLATGFAGVVYRWQGTEPAQEYLAGYLIEKSLSVDNLVIFSLLFAYFRVPSAEQHRVLFLGVLGALVMRAACILGGVALIDRFSWMSYLLGCVLLLASVRLAAQGDLPRGKDPGRNAVVRAFRRVIPVTAEFQGARFVLRRDGQWFATPLMVALMALEAADLVFALDSIPAVLAVTTDPFIVFSSNVFALLGLRALYFVIADVQSRLRHLKPALAFVLAFVGLKLLLSHLIVIPVWLSLTVIAGALGIAVLTSRWHHAATG
jgi:tellurite resistance protein TerC